MSELFEDLDPKIAGPLQRITEALRAEIGSQIAGVRQDVQSLIGSEAESVSEAEAPSTAGAPATDQQDALEELKHAAAKIDRSTKQTAILSALLEGAGRFSSRSAFILIRDDGQRCWGSLGFDDAGREMTGASVEVPNGSSAWARIQDGSGTRGLSAEECAVFCAQFEAPASDLGALLPLSLGDHVAGYLYADRVGNGSLNITALQLLTFVAGQTLETLPVRKRTSTPTLVVADAGAEPAVDVAEAAAPVPVEEPAAEAEVALDEPVDEVAGVETAVDTIEPEGDAIEAQGEALPEGLLETIPVEAEEETETLAAEPEPEPEPEPEIATPAADTDFYEVDSAAVEEAPVAPLEVEEVEEAVPAQEIEEPATEGSTAELPLPPTEEVTEEYAAEPAAPQPEAAAPPPAPPADASSTQVMPPDDILGPGWAFTTKDGAEETGNEALHEEARRLARLLVTEIKLYNEEQVDQGRRSGDIYRRLQEDIDRSRQIFEDRIEEQIRRDNDYFRDALVRILAGGDESVLGM